VVFKLGLDEDLMEIAGLARWHHPEE